MASFTLTYSAPTIDATEHYATRAEAEAAATEARAAMVAVGYGAHVDSIVITEDAAPTRAELAADVVAADAARTAARRAVSEAEAAAAGTYAGSDEWYAVDAADRALRSAGRTYRAACAALAAYDRAGDDRAAAARYVREDAHARFMASTRPAVYSR